MIRKQIYEYGGRRYVLTDNHRRESCDLTIRLLHLFPFLDVVKVFRGGGLRSFDQSLFNSQLSFKDPVAEWTNLFDNGTPNVMTHPDYWPVGLRL